MWIITTGSLKLDAALSLTVMLLSPHPIVWLSCAAHLIAIATIWVAD